MSGDVTRRVFVPREVAEALIGIGWARPVEDETTAVAGKFDRVAYQREYMRRRRAAAKVRNGG